MIQCFKKYAGLLFFTTFILFTTQLFANNNDDDYDVRDLDFKERIFFGGYIGLQFGDFTFVDISPIAGYRITNKLSAGIGLTYQYFHDRFFGYGTHTFGGSTFARFLIIPQAFVYAEYEMLNLESTYFFEDNGNRFWEYNYFLGAGYRQRIGSRAFFNIMLLYNFNDDSFVYFQNPIFRFSIEVGL